MRAEEIMAFGIGRALKKIAKKGAHAVKRAFGEPSSAEKRLIKAAEQEAADAKAEEQAQKEALALQSRNRRRGRSMMSTWTGDEENTIGA